MRSGGNNCYGLRFEGSVLKALKAQAQADVPDMADQADLPAVVDVVDVANVADVAAMVDVADVAAVADAEAKP